jgi:hypothetical protein
MPNKRKQYPVPKFHNLEEEDKFWQSHSPLMEGYEGKVQKKKKQNRASFLSIRLTGEELAQLRDKAIRYGLGPSTYARQVIIQAIESEQYSLPPDLLFSVYTQLAQLSGEQNEEFYRELNNTYKTYLDTRDTVAKEIATLCHPRLANKELQEFLRKIDENRQSLSQIRDTTE